MKKNLLLALSYVVVAMLATVLTLATAPEYMLRPDKLSQLEALIEEKYIDEADVTAMEDAAAAAMVKATGDKWSYYIPADEYEAYQERMANAYVGVGITIQAVEEGGFPTRIDGVSFSTSTAVPPDAANDDEPLIR